MVVSKNLLILNESWWVWNTLKNIHYRALYIVNKCCQGIEIYCLIEYRSIFFCILTVSHIYYSILSYCACLILNELELIYAGSTILSKSSYVCYCLSNFRKIYNAKFWIRLYLSCSICSIYWWRNISTANQIYTVYKIQIAINSAVWKIVVRPSRVRSIFYQTSKIKVWLNSLCRCFGISTALIWKFILCASIRVKCWVISGAFLGCTCRICGIAVLRNVRRFLVLREYPLSKYRAIWAYCCNRLLC